MSLVDGGLRPRFDHLARLTDQRGLFEHALHAEPRPEHGYCLDDAARGLLVVCREPHPLPAVKRLGRRYLDFTLAAVLPDGSCRNRMSVAGEWTDPPSVGDCWGRALWGLGEASVRAPSAAMRAQALLGFRVAARLRSPHQRAMAFAALGAGAVLAQRPDEVCAADLLRDAVQALDPPDVARSAQWPWPQTRLTYANGSVVDALLLAGAALPDPATRARGLVLLDFLLAAQTRDGHLSVTPVGGWGPLDRGPDFDQQPIEVAAIADAAARAFTMTGDPRWRDGVRMAWAWFLGDNDGGMSMVDPQTGAGYDGLEADGRNLNRGAESTLAALSTHQHAVRLGVLR